VLARTPRAGAAPSEFGIGRDLEVRRLLGEGGEPERAARVLHEAGRRALAAGALAAAEPALRAASACTAEDGELGIGIGCDLARVLLLAGQSAAASQLAARLAGPAAVTRCDLAAHLLLLRARAALAVGRWDDAAACLRQLQAGDRAGATAAEAVLLSAQVALGDSAPGSRAGAEHQAAQAVGLARQAGRPDLECEALEVMGLCARLRDLNAGALGLAAGIELNLAAVLTMTASFDEASAVADAAGQTAGRLGLRPIEAASQMLLGLTAAYQGRRRDMDRRLAAAEALAPDDADLRAGAWGLGRGMLALLEEDRPAAIRAFARARAEAPDQHARILDPFQGPELLLQALAGQVTAGQVEQAAASAVRAARWPQLWASTTLAIVRGAGGDQPGAGRALAAALEAGERYPIFCAIAQRLAAEAALRDRWGDPVALLRSADTTFTRFGVRRAAAACEGLLRAAGQRAPRRRAGDASLPAGLLRAGVTRREAEVLELVADRLTNPEIAQRLYLSPRTVEKHVAALMLKLGAADRATLAELARAAPHNGGNLPMCPALRALIIKHIRSANHRRAPWPSPQSSSSPTTRPTSTSRSSRPAGCRSWTSRADSTTSATGPRPGSPWWTCGRTSSPSPPSARSSARPPSRPGWTPSRWSTPSRA
jgi:DNA-binding CsgD family transcriptional regulator